jgi:hypothetical protein
MCHKCLNFLLTQVFFVVNILDFVVINKYSAVELSGSSHLKQFVRCMKWNFELRRIVLPGALMLAAISLGCSRSDLAAIKGRVKFKNGDEIKRGTIEYALTDSKVAYQSGARIADGAYEIPREKGLRPGKYVVRIYAPASLLSPQGAPGSVGTPAGAGGQALQLPEERVSPAFNSQSKLVVKVTDEPIQTFDFEVN